MTAAVRWFDIAAAVAVKDLRSEARGRTIVSVWMTLGLLLLAVVLITVSASDVAIESIVPSALWLVFALVGTLAVGRGYNDEHTLGGWRGIGTTPVPPGAVYLGKLAGNLVVTLIAELTVVIGYSLAFAWPQDSIGMLVTLVLGTIGLSSIGTLAAAFLSDRQAGDLLLPVMVLPVAVPVIALSAQLTRASLDDRLTSSWWTVIVVLVGYDLIVVLGSTAAFSFVTDRG